MKAIFITTEEINSNNTSLYFKMSGFFSKHLWTKAMEHKYCEWVGGGMETP